MCGRRLGRAMLRPLFDQKSRRDGHMSPELRRALEWWLRMLRCGLSEKKPWSEDISTPLHLFCDASGSPAHLGAVLFTETSCLYTEMVPDRAMLERFRRRRDNKIMGLELLAISLGLCTFAELLMDRRVVVHCDNKGAEVRIYGVRSTCR